MAQKIVTPKLDARAVAEAIDEELSNPKPVQLAIVEHYITEGWRENPLNDAMSNRLLSADRCISAVQVMHNLLHRDAMAKMDLANAHDEDEETIVYPVLKYDEADSLYMGMQELLLQAKDVLNGIRENECQIATRQSRGER
jgi:hypothetical protein